MSIKTAVCISGAMTHLEYFDNIKATVLDPYEADVFIHTWVPGSVNSDTLNLRYTGGVTFNETDAVIEKYQPKMIVVEDFRTVNVKERIMSNLPSSVSGGVHFKENVFFMFYKIWSCNELRKQYEIDNNMKYERVIRLRFDISYTEFPLIVPPPNTVYIPDCGNYGGICDMCAVGDGVSMDKYAELWNELFVFVREGIQTHPETALKTHLERQGLCVERFGCEMFLRGKKVPM